MANSARVYIGRLSYQARERDVERFFRGYGRLKEVNLKNGFGFVEFEDSRDADDAVYDLNGRDLCGERVSVEHARGSARYRGGERDNYYNNGPPRRRGGGIDKYGPPVRTEFRIIVENLSSRVSWQDLKDYMRQAGEVTFADAHKQATNEGIVEFATLYDMESAIKKLDGTELSGRKIRLVEDRPSRGRSFMFVCVCVCVDHDQDPEAGAAQGADHVQDQDRGESPGVSHAAEVQERVGQEVEARPQRKVEAEVEVPKLVINRGHLADQSLVQEAQIEMIKI
ncbi:Serine/arginine-rich splicing factor 4 [Holothuria leucospilota]|uniref:Serine/arginine-rich splicing factor 4 n=1 Tax=Holothuria leucospilota TaxID=206669 RepID=A0A9Q1CJU4_HOLLE|nr:Serine/arginine-rich splicing factor 4 [Holothuria leucospilota]